eukprot:scaffold27660_cov34-Tisochrysis_lutea.AAC.2
MIASSGSVQGVDIARPCIMRASPMRAHRPSFRVWSRKLCAGKHGMQLSTCIVQPYQLDACNGGFSLAQDVPARSRSRVPRQAELRLHQHGLAQRRSEQGNRYQVWTQLSYVRCLCPWGNASSSAKKRSDNWETISPRRDHEVRHRSRTLIGHGAPGHLQSAMGDGLVGSNSGHTNRVAHFLELVLLPGLERGTSSIACA